MRQKTPDFNPLNKMIEVIEDETVPENVRMLALKEVTKYLLPQRKSVEYSADEGNVTVVVQTGVPESDKDVD